MLLKCSTLDKRALPSKGKGKSTRLSPGVKMTINGGNSRIHRKVLRIPAKRHPGKALPGKLHSLSKVSPGKLTPGKRLISRPNPPPCDNSNDSGFGFDQHVETTYSNTAIVRPTPAVRSNQLFIDGHRKNNDDVFSNIKSHTIIANNAKRLKLDNINIDSDDTCSNDAFFFAQRHKEETTTQPATSTSQKVLNSMLGRNTSRAPQRRLGNSVTLQSQVGSIARDGSSQLQILVQPEQQHRARYQTEGSRGAVKDRSGNGFPIVKLVGYAKPTVLQVFIGTDVGRVTPHMFYQACKVSGKNSTPCIEKKLDGTIVIEIELKPENEMTVTCDCVGILKERNVDVEHRFPEQSGPRSKKKSTRCRMVFRSQVTNDDGSIETLQVCSQQIICTQPPGVPEISKKSLMSCPATGGLELFIIGKNFLKDTRVIFQTQENDTSCVEPLWEENVIPDKEYLQQTHLVCTVPPYMNTDIKEPLNIQIYVLSSGKRSEPHNFVYTPKGTYSILSAATTNVAIHNQNSMLTTSPDICYTDEPVWNTNNEPKNEIDSDMMPPPTGLPLTVRRSSTAGSLISEQMSPTMNSLKSEILDENSQNSIVEAIGNEAIERYSVNNENTVDTATIKDILFSQTEIRKHGMDMSEENSNMSMISNETPMEVNSIPMNNFNGGHLEMITQPNLKVIDLRVKQEQQIAAQIQEFVNNSQNHILPTLSSLDTNVNQLKNQLEVESVAAALFNTTQNTTNVFPSQIINPSSSKQLINQPTFLNNLCTEATATQLNQMLKIPQNHVSPEMEVLNNSNDSIMSDPSSNRSPLAQDIILNSQSAVLNNTSSGLGNVLSNSNSPQSQHSMSPEVILNPSVSPSMMCQTTTDPASLLGQQVTLANAMLNGISLSQSTQDTLLNNLIPPVMNQTNDTMHMHKNQIAVKNMYLNAANEILNTQPTESTINALIQMDQPILNNQEQQVPPMIINQNPQNHNSNEIQNQISMFNGTENVITNNVHQIMTQNNMTNENTNALMRDVSMSLLNQAVANEQQIRAQEEYIRAANNANLSQELSNLTQESHLQNLSLGRNVLTMNEPKNVVHVNQQNVVATSSATTIPQELTTMSDHDLISYINPSCFDQM